MDKTLKITEMKKLTRTKRKQKELRKNGKKREG
jgi:hypothetical protein